MLAGRTVALALGVGLLARLAALALVAFDTASGDGVAYAALARNMVRHGTFGLGSVPPIEPTVVRAPAYPALLAAVFATAGENYWVVRAVQVVVSLATCCLVAFTVRGIAARDARLPRATPAVVLWLLALSPFDAVYTGAVLSETLCTALLALAVCLPVLLPERARARWLLAGMALGGACLTRDVYLAFVPFAMGAWALLTPRPRPWGALAVQLGALALGAALVIAPWTARNYARTGAVVPVSKGNLGMALWIGAWATDGSFTLTDAQYGMRVWPAHAFLRPEDRAIAAAASDTSEGEARNRAYMDLFKARFRQEPARVITRWFVRLPRLWVSTRFDIFGFRPAALRYGTRPWWLLKLGLLALDTALLAAGLAGIAIAWRWRARALLWLAAPMAYITLVFLPLNSFESRYSQPTLPLLTAFAGLACAVLYARVAARRAAISARNAS